MKAIRIDQLINSSLMMSLLFVIQACSSDDAVLHLRIIETTDLHSNIMDFDYYKNRPTEKFGLVRTASLIKQARAEVINSVLVDNGDLIQGSPLGDYIADQGLEKQQVHPVYQAMNTLNYDVGNLGNHEFNYGLEFLQKAIAGANFPYINANILDYQTKQPYFTPYKILSYDFKDQVGKSQSIKVGYIGFVPPQILLWDRVNLEGKVLLQDIKKSAEFWVPKIKAEGADIIIAIPHSGLSTDEYNNKAENSVYYLSQVPDINAITFGHSHALFPGKDFEDLKGIDNATGQVNGVAAVMPGRWGSHLGVIDLKLKYLDDKWIVISSQSEVRPIYDEMNNQSLVAADKVILAAVDDAHKNTKLFMTQPIGKSSENIYSYLALVQDDPSVELVNLAQIDYVKQLIQGDPDLADFAVLSATAPFKTGGRKNDPSNFTEVEAGVLSFRNAADLYPYPNTLVVLKITGADVKEWLECSAGLFNQIDEEVDSAQALINWSGFRSYNFDVIEGVTYAIDISQPAKYNEKCELVNQSSNRIKQLSFKGKAIDPNQEFLIATNNYRAYTGYFAGTGIDNVVIQSPDENRTVVANYIKKQTTEKGELQPSVNENWAFAAIQSHSRKHITLLFETSPSDKATKFISEKAIHPMERVTTDDLGFAIYHLKLSTIPKPK